VALDALVGRRCALVDVDDALNCARRVMPAS
jgi:hypothetical protein